VALYLEETGFPYELVSVDTLLGEQTTPGIPVDKSQWQDARFDRWR
jgi:hypothetical protein